MAGLTRFFWVLLFSCGLMSVLLAQKEEPLSTEPQALYIFPVGGQQGSTVKVTIDGQTLADTYAVWTDCEELQASVERVDETDRKIWEAEYVPEKQLTHQVTVQVRISPAAELGGHSLRLVSRRGISNPMPFRVSSGLEPVVLEDENQTDTDKPTQGQSVQYPVAINGRIGRIVGGEVDYYGFDVEAGRELYFEVFFPLLGGVDDFAGGKMLLYLYELSPSWVDPYRLVQLAFNDAPVAQAGSLFGKTSRIVRARLKHRFTRSDRYLIAVKAFDDRGGPKFVYQLRIAPSPLQEMAGNNQAWPLAHPVADRWKERGFDRQLSASHLEELSRRTVLVEGGAQELEVTAGSSVRGDVVDKGSQVRVPIVELPSLLEGAIDNPGKTDYFKFKAEAGKGLVFEVETPREGSPVFSPWVKILDAQQEVVFSSIYNLVEGNNVQLFRYLEPKMVYTFEKGGEYTVQVRDLTSRYGGPGFAYRLLIRPQVPHIGELKLDVDRINLVQGEAKQLTVTADREEGFVGEIAIGVGNLPAGVQAYPTVIVESDRPPPFDEGQKRVFRPETQKVSITLIAEEGASTTKLPCFVRVKARAVVNGTPGAEIAVGEIPLMVVSAQQSQTSEETDQVSQN